MGIVKDFWQEPTFVELMLPMQEAIHDYVVNGKGTAKEASLAVPLPLTT